MPAQVPRVMEWCRRCRARGLDSPLQLHPINRNEAIKVCSNVECWDKVNGSIQSEIVKIDVMSRLHEFGSGPISITDNLYDSDDGSGYHCRKASSRNALVTAKPLGQPSVGIGDSTSTAAVCSEPSVYANSSEHVYRECQTFMSNCCDAGQALITPVVEPIVSKCANPDVCMDAKKPTGNVFCDSASLCADFSLCELWSNIFDCEFPCADNMCVDAKEPTDTSDSTLLFADSSVCGDTGESTSNIRSNTSACADSNVCVDMEEQVYMTPGSSVVTCGDANRATAEKEEVGGVPVPDDVQTSFSARTLLRASSHEHGSRSRDAFHIPITAVQTTVRVITSSDSDLDDSLMTPSSADLSSEAKRIDTSDGHAFYTSLMPKPVAVKVVASSERPLGLSKAELPIAKSCLEKNEEEPIEKMRRLFNVHRIEEVLNLKVVASWKVEPGLCKSVSTPTLLPPTGTDSWIEELPEELEDEVNYAVHEKENVVAVSTACVTNAAFSSTAALGAVDVENTFSHDGASLSTLSQEQEAISATICDSTDSFEHCDDGSSMPSAEGLPENDQSVGETPKLPKPLQEIGADAGSTTSHEPDVAEIAINSPSQLDKSEVVQECHYQEEQSCTIAADQATLVVAKERSAEVLGQPASEASFVENHEIGSEVEIISTEPPKLLEIQTCSEASLSESFAGGPESLEVPMYPKEPLRSTENVHCYHDLHSSTRAPRGLPSLEGKSEGGLPHCPEAANAAPSTELARPVLKESNIIQGSSLGKATSETISPPQALCNEKAGIEGVLSAASYCSSPPGRSEVYSLEGSVVASETQSVGLVELSQTAHGDDSRTVTNHPAPSAIPNGIAGPTAVSSVISAPGPVEGSLKDLSEDPLAASLYIARSMSIIGPRNVVPQSLSAEDSRTNASLTEKISLQSSDLNVKYFTELKSNVGGEGGCLSLTATAPHQRPTYSSKRTRSLSPSATLSATVRPSSHTGSGSGTLQQCVSTGILLPSSRSALCNKPSSSDVQEREVKRARRGCEAMKVTIGTTATGKAVVLCVSGLQKSVQNVVLKLPSDVVTGGETQAAAVRPLNKRARAQNARTKQQEQVESAVASKGRKSKTTENKNKPPSPPKQKVTRTGIAAVDKLAAINEALAAPIASESAPKKSEINARAQRQSGRTCPNKKERQSRKWPIGLPKEAKLVSSIKRRSGTPNEQVVPDVGPVLSPPTSSDLSSISSKPSKSSFSGTSYNAASSFSTSKTGNSWQSNRSFKSVEEYVQAIKNSRFPMEESGSGFPGYHTVLAARPPYKKDKKSTVIAPKRRRTKAETSARPTTEAASATIGAELDRYVSELSASTDVINCDVFSELFDSTA